MTGMPDDSAAVAPTRTFTQRDMDEFGIASGGTGLIHTEPAYAAATPYGATLVQGIYLLAVIEAHLCARVPNWCHGGVLEVKFIAPVTEGTPFTVEITEAAAGPGEGDRSVGADGTNADRSGSGRHGVGGPGLRSGPSEGGRSRGANWDTNDSRSRGSIDTSASQPSSDPACPPVQYLEGARR